MSHICLLNQMLTHTAGFLLLYNTKVIMSRC